MVVGKGMVAKGFSSYEKNNEVLIFASGVSNSTNKDIAKFEKEKTLLLEIMATNPGKQLVYFSTCSVYDESIRESPYVLHKLQMESIIERAHSNFLIFRVSNIAGRTKNPHTILNYFFTHIKDGVHFNLWENAKRNIISMDDLFILCNKIIEQHLFKNEIINVANPVSYDVKYIVSALEKFIGKKGNYTLIQKGSGPQINLSKIKHCMNNLDMHFNDEYLQNILQQYFVKP